MKKIKEILGFLNALESEELHSVLQKMDSVSWHGMTGAVELGMTSSFQSIYLDSKKCTSSSIFVALKGLTSDGNDYIEDAFAKGVKLVLTDSNKNLSQITSQKGDSQSKLGMIEVVEVSFTANSHPELVSGSHDRLRGVFKATDTKNELPKIIFVPNLKDKLADIAQWFYDYKKPANVIGITGTNGKTSISNYIAEFLSLDNSQALLLGTNGNGIYPNLLESTHTTLDVLSLYEMITKYQDKAPSTHKGDSQSDLGMTVGCEELPRLAPQSTPSQCEGEFISLIMEVSSHSLDQGRTKGLDFDVAVFSNLTLDHLDYHKTMENYFLAKAKLFQSDSLKYSIINIDDDYGKRLVKLAKGKVITVSLLDDTADIYLQVLAIENMVTSFALYDSCKKVGEYKTTLLGGFNLMNLALSIAALKSSYSFKTILKNIDNIEPVKGRMEVIALKKNTQIIIDYAHTPDAMENVLKTLQQYNPRKLWCIFGCGGNRDTSKRAIMGSIAEKYADNVIVTEDNNRLEKIESIFADIKKGFEKPAEHSFIDSREDAIKYAIDNAEQGDIILLAGKGHECYLDKNGNKEYFDERLVVYKYV